MRRLLLVLVVLLSTAPGLGAAGASTAGTSGTGVPEVAGDFLDPALPGPYAVGRHHLALTNGSRPVDLDIWYPADVGPDDLPSVYDLVYATITSPRAYADPAIAEGEFPIVSFSHGSEAINFQSYDTMEHWASHGYIVVAPTHHGHDIVAKVEGTTVGLWTTIVDRAADTRFGIDIVVALYGGHVLRDEAGDPMVAASGHSMGGWAALVQSDGYIAGDVEIAPDPRVDAVLAISPFTGVILEAQFAAMRDPVMAFGGSADETLPVDHHAARLYLEHGARRKFRVDVDAATHVSPSNACELRDAIADSDQDPPPELIAALDELARRACAPETRPTAHVMGMLNYFGVAFFERMLKGTGGVGNIEQYPYLKRGYADDFPVCYWRDDDEQPTYDPDLVVGCLPTKK